MSALAAAVLWVLLLVPAAVAAGLTVWAGRRLRGRLPQRAVRVTRVLWGVATLALLAAPILTVYTLRTTTGRWSAPAPGLVGFRVAGWLTLGGFGLVLAGGALAAAVERWGGA